MYFDQQKWIADSTGANGYRSSMIQKIESDSSFISRSKFYINCVFSTEYNLHRKIGGKTLIYKWCYNGYQTFLIFEFRRNRVVEVRHFKGCG